VAEKGRSKKVFFWWARIPSPGRQRGPSGGTGISWDGTKYAEWELKSRFCGDVYSGPQCDTSVHFGMWRLAAWDEIGEIAPR
jgi:hypothetical protein